MTMPAASPPPPPGATTARRHGARQFGLIWIPVSATGGSAITGYEVQSEVDGEQRGWTPIPGSGADTASYIVPEGRIGMLWNLAAATEPGAFDDPGLRSIFTRAPTRQTRGRLNLAYAPAGAPVVLGTGGERCRRFQANAGRINIDIGAQAGAMVDLPDDAERNWGFAVRNDSTRQVWGPFYFRDDISPPNQPSDPYAIAWPAGLGYDVFEAGFTPRTVTRNTIVNETITCIIFDPRPGRLGETLTFDTRLDLGAQYRFRVRAVNAAGGGVPGGWSNPVSLGLRPAPPSVLSAGDTRVRVFPEATTSYTVKAPGFDAPATVQCAVVAPRRGLPVYDAIQVELGDCDASFAFTTSRFGPISFIAQSCEWEVSAHTEASASFVLRAASLDDAREYRTHPFLRVRLISGPREDTVFLGEIDRSRGGIREEGKSQQYLVHVAAATMWRRASRNILTSEDTDRPVGGLLYAALDLPINHLRVGIDKFGPMLPADEREHGTDPIWVQAALNHPLTYADAARAIGGSTANGWQMAPDGFFHPQLDPDYPARVIDNLDGVWDFRIRGIGAVQPRRRQFALFDHPEGAQTFSVDGRHYRVPSGSTAAGYDPREEDYDGQAGRVIVEKEWYEEIGGVNVKMVRLLVMDPGGYGARYPLPALVAPELRRVSVVRLAYGSAENAGVSYSPSRVVINAQRNVPFTHTIPRRASGGTPPYTYAVAFTRAPGVQITGNTIGGTVAEAGLYVGTLTITDKDSNELVVPIQLRVAGLATTGDTILPAPVDVEDKDEDLSDHSERQWYLTNTHLERAGWLNSPALRGQFAPGNPWVADAAGGAFRSEQSGWRFAVSVDIIDRAPNPIAVSWSSLTPDYIGRAVDIKGFGGPAGLLRIVRIQARVHSILTGGGEVRADGSPAGLTVGPSDGVRIQWDFTALQSAALEESMSGEELMREIKRRTEEDDD